MSSSYIPSFKSSDELIKQLSTEDPKVATKKISEFYAKARYRLSDEDFHRQFTDGKDDGGIDFYNTEDSTNFILQSKFVGSPIRIDAGAITDELRKAINSITNENPNLRAADFVNGVRREFDNPDAVLEFIWLTTNTVRQTVREEVQSWLDSVRLEKGWKMLLDFIAIDKETLDNVIYDYAHGFIPYTGKKSLRIEGCLYIENKGIATNVNSLLCTIKCSNLLKWFEDSGDIQNYLQKNIREYVGDTPINKGIAQSFHDQPAWFWYKHNGIIIFADTVHIDKTKCELVLRNPQIVNGGQTVRSLFSVFDKEGRKENAAEVLIRVYRLPYDDSKVYESSIDIIEGLNTQTAIKSSDLRSTDPRQVKIERLMKPLGYTYRRKRAKWSKSSSLEIKMTDLALMYYVCLKHAPHEGVIGEVEEIFEEDSKYEQVFPAEEKIDTQLSIDNIILRYLTMWNIYYGVIAKVERNQLPNRDAELCSYTEYFVLSDIYDKLWDWEAKYFDLRGWTNWKEFIESDVLYQELASYCQRAFRIAREIIPKSEEDKRDYLRRKEATEKFRSAMGSSRNFDSATNSALRLFKDEKSL